MPEYIEREALIYWLNNVDGIIADGTVEAPALYNQIITDIKNFPAADVEVVRRGEWVCVNDTDNVWMCDGADGCGGEIILLEGTPLDSEWERCPYCGARMDGKGDRDG